MAPTFVAIGGDPQATDKLLKGHRVGNTTYKAHLDGYNLVPYLAGQAPKGAPESFIYINDDQQVTALRYDNWKLVFMEQRVFNLRTDPYERADITSNTYYELDHRPRLPAGTRAGLRRQFPRAVQGIPAAPEGRELQPGRGDGDVEGRCRVEVSPGRG